MSTLDSTTQLGVSAEIEPTFKALRTVQRPLEYQSWGSGGITRTQGHYAYENSNSPLAFAANAGLGCFRHVDPGSVAVLTRVSAVVWVVTAVTAQVMGPVFLYRLEGFNADPTTGVGIQVGAPVGPTRMRNTMAPFTAHIGALSVAGGITGFPAAVTSNVVGHASLGNTLTAIGTYSQTMELYNINNSGAYKHPLVFAANEGAEILWGNVAVATGTVSISMLWEWAEVPEF